MDQRKKWNDKYTYRLNEKIQNNPNTRLISVSPYLSSGRALDIACGLGANSVFLAELGYQVLSLDISDIAIGYLEEEVRKKGLSIKPNVYDLTDIQQLHNKNDSFDLIVITYYLDRKIFPILSNLIKEDGYVFIETFFKSPQNKENSISEKYMLEPNELLSVFKEWHVLLYEENEQDGRQTIFVRKP